MRLYTKLLLALLAGVLAGGLSQWIEADWLRKALIFLEPFGFAFIRLISMVVVPLVVSSLFVATSSFGDTRRLAGVGGKTLAYFLVTTLIATLIGLVVALAIEPGANIDAGVREALAAQFQETTAGAQAAIESRPSLVETLVEMIPSNPFAAAAHMELLPLIIGTIIFGSAASFVPEDRRRVLVAFFEGVNEVCMVVIEWVMKLAPYAVFVLIAATMARFGLELLERLFVYCLVVAVGLLIHFVGTFSLAVKFLARMKVGTFFRHIAQAPLVAFSTSSSNAALPVSMEVAQQNLGISREISSFVLPLGATLNMNGSALYKVVTAVFVAQVYGVPLGFEEQFAIVVTSILAAIAGVGVPGSALVTTLMVLSSFGLGVEAAVGMALVIGVDRPLDMLRTTVNITGDLTCAAYIARSEGEELND
jgi:Na+/H+-dicarboxylate symporter